MSNNLFVPVTSNIEPYKYTNTCADCGAKNIKIQRKHKGKSYCINCYKKSFKKKPCETCGELHPFHVDDVELVCPECLRKQPCICCGKDAYKNGTNTADGRVCQSCKRYRLTPKKVCFECGVEKSNVRQYKIIGHNHEICVSCYRKHSSEICLCCHHYRSHKNMVETPNGRKCRKCYEVGKMPCPNCQELMWAGVGKRCWDCYYSEKIKKEVVQNKFVFQSNVIKDEYISFVEWFGQNKGMEKAKKKHTNFVDFFARCDSIWSKIPSYQSLVQEFKPEGLRQYLTVLKWLTDTNRIVVDETLKEQVAEEERIESLIAKLGDSLPVIVEEYLTYLKDRRERRKTTFKSVRTSFQPVVGIYEQFSLKEADTPSQKQIDIYLKKKRGQARNLYSFIVFLREKYQVELDCIAPDKRVTQKSKRKDSEDELMRLFNLPKPVQPKTMLKWLQVSMFYFHNQEISLTELKGMKVEEKTDLDMLQLTYHGKNYSIPKL